jgi:hypothetical protein
MSLTLLPGCHLFVFYFESGIDDSLQTKNVAAHVGILGTGEWIFFFPCHASYMTLFTIFQW